MSQQSEEIEATVGVIRGEGERAFAVAYPSSNRFFKKGTDITFSLSLWRGSQLPSKGQIVVLSEIVKFKKGWRALSARPVLPVDTSQGRA